jgi:exodeoxyribonuclease V alpha subunit
MRVGARLLFMREFKGYVSQIIYRNNENAYTVFQVNCEGEEITCTGFPAAIGEGESCKVTGEFVEHPVYGQQLKVSTYEPCAPEDRQAVFRYLSSGAIKGIGETLAKRILVKFGDDTMRILDEEPERLSEVRGISERIAREIAAQVEEKRDVRDALLFLQRYGISNRQAIRIWDTYGMEMYGILKENPYRLAEDIDGIGFARADEIATRIGILPDSDFRIRSGILYCLSQTLGEGSSYLPRPILIQRTRELLKVPEESIDIQLDNLAMERKVIIRVKSLGTDSSVGNSAPAASAPATATATAAAVDPADDPEEEGFFPMPEDMEESSLEVTPMRPFQTILGDASVPEAPIQAKPPARISPAGAAKCAALGRGEEVQVYSASAFRIEQQIAKRLLELDRAPAQTGTDEEVLRLIREIEDNEGIELDELQRQAVLQAVNGGILLISGGPGTGKTTTINTIIRYFISNVKSVLLAAPTGRAAKRMTEATGYEATTIHRLLGYKAMGDVSEAEKRRFTPYNFDRDENNPLEADAVIIDEMSMVDIYLFYALLKAIRPGTKLIMVGDVNQLPSVGPGRILQDMIDSGRFRTVMLRKIFRQASRSDIIMNAHRILDGEPLVLDNKKSRDFFLLERRDPNVIYKHIVMLMQQMLPGYVHCAASEIQVLTPMRKGALGALRLNEVLQSVLNPAAPDKREYQAHEVTFREGDKVMQMRNNYQLEWEVPGNFNLPIDKGTGIFNGDFGVILSIDEHRQIVLIRFDDNKVVHYPFGNLDDLELAYAITVHKSQGSEYPAVILPLLSGPRTLFYRNLLYTAVTRAKKCVVILGSSDTVREMAANVRQNTRYTGLKDRLCELG